MNAIVYVDRTGIAWRYLPHDYPPWATVYWYFAAWRDEEVFTELNGLLRRLVRQAEGRNPEASACVIDAQSVKTSANVPVTGQGTDAAKKIVGRKRSIAVDTLGLLLAVLVTAAGVQDSAAGISLLDQLATGHPTLSKAWVDGGYHRAHFIDHAAHPRHRRPGRTPRPRHPRVHRPASPMGRRTHLRLAHAASPPGP
ncbi:hypothetical protein GCM10018952_61530 [Streptosporangium vulgare]